MKTGDDTDRAASAAHDSEERLLRRAAKDPAQFRVLYERYFQTIFRYIYRRVDDEDTAADLTSQTFYNALKNLKKYTHRGLPFSAWLYRIASNELARHYDERKRTVTYHLEADYMKTLSTDGLEAGEDPERMRRLLKNLKKRDVEILELRYLEGKGFNEIAYILSISEASAKMRAYRAIARLRSRTDRDDRRIA